MIRSLTNRMIICISQLTADTTTYRGKPIMMVLNLTIASGVRILFCVIRMLANTFSVARVIVFAVQGLIRLTRALAITIAVTAMPIVAPVPGAPVVLLLLVIFGWLWQLHSTLAS
eukprot:1518201-Ditylum_brightwellii.AAC.2